MKAKRRFGSDRAKILAIAVLAVLIVLLLPRYEDREDMYNKVPDVMKCSQDSDCVLTMAAACSPQCPNVVNKFYKAAWESFPTSEEEKRRCAIAGTCVNFGEPLVPKCENGRCITSFGPEPEFPTESFP